MAYNQILLRQAVVMGLLLSAGGTSAVIVRMQVTVENSRPPVRSASHPCALAFLTTASTPATMARLRRP